MSAASSGGRPRDEETLLAVNAERYRLKSSLEEAIENAFDWSAGPDWDGGRTHGDRHLQDGRDLSRSRTRRVRGEDDWKHHAASLDAVPTHTGREQRCSMPNTRTALRCD